MPMEWPDIPAAGPPTTAEPDDFDERADDWVQFENDWAEAMVANSPTIESAYDAAVAANAGANAALLAVANAAGLLGLSTTSMALTAGSKSPVVTGTGLAFADGDEVVFIARANGSARLYGIATDVVASPGTWDFDVDEAAGSGGPYDAWFVIPKAFEPFIPPENANPVLPFIMALNQPGFAPEVGENVRGFPAPFDMDLTGLLPFVQVRTAQATGSALAFDIKAGGATIFSTKPTIDNTETSSLTATAPAVLSTTFIAAGTWIDYDIDQVGSSSTARSAVAVILARQA